MAANRLTQRDDVTVTLINPRAKFVERMRLFQLVTGSDDAVVDYRDVLSEDVLLVVDTATRIDAPGRTVALATGNRVGYDYLIYAAGSGSGSPTVPGVAEFAYSTSTLEDAKRLRSVVNNAPGDALMTVVGSGPTGIETAAELAQQGRRVSLVCGEVLGPYLHPRGRSSAARRLANLGATVLKGSGTRVTAVTRDTVLLSDGRELPSTVTIWTAGFGVPDLAALSGLSIDTAGRLLTDETLTSLDDKRIVAAGDSAAPSDLPYRMSAYSARPLGAHAADTVLSRIAGKEPAPFNLGFYGICISLGRRFAMLQYARKDDTATGFTLSGRLVGLLVKEASTRGLIKQLKREARKPGSFAWAKADKRQELLRAKRGKALATH
jgi:NADH dehydrogenase FAD-containing subunit